MKLVKVVHEGTEIAIRGIETVEQLKEALVSFTNIEEHY
jgi:hypothetical protein